jgi:ADP-ribose pyrophosphatase YjhB (NUDIX family)
MIKDYAYENGVEVDINKFKRLHISSEIWHKFHAQLPIACHDIFIKIDGGILLVNRKLDPAKDMLWPIGGRIKRGIRTITSLKTKVKEECNLDIDNITHLGCARTFFRTDPFNHNNGTDTPVFVFFGEGRGEIKLDELHSTPRIVTHREYTEEFRKRLHPYVRDFMDEAMKLI